MKPLKLAELGYGVRFIRVPFYSVCTHRFTTAMQGNSAFSEQLKVQQHALLRVLCWCFLPVASERKLLCIFGGALYATDAL